MLTVLAAAIPLVLGSASPSLDVKKSPTAHTLTTTGKNPHIWTTAIPKSATPETHPILSFDYFSLKPIPNLILRIPRDPEDIHHTTGPIPFSETWTSHSIDLRKTQPYLSGKNHRFALILATQPGHSFQIKNLRLRAPTAQEEQQAADRQKILTAREADASAYLAYLDKTYPVPTPSLTVDKSNLTFNLTLPNKPTHKIALAHVPLHHPSYLPLPADHPLEKSSPHAPGPLTITLPRFSNKTDRATSRWQLLALTPDNQRLPLTPFFYPTQHRDQRTLPTHTHTSIKGLGGIPTLTPNHEIFTLGIQHATINILVNGLLSTTPTTATKPFPFEGKTYHLNPNYLKKIANNARILTSKKITASAILLVGNNRHPDGSPRTSYIHPEALPDGKYTIPNLATPEGAHLYRAAIHLLTDRFTQPHQYIANWIIHNEVDQSGTWTNMGSQPLPRYLETYLRSARLTHHSARRFDPHARVFLSLTHHWTHQSAGRHTFVVRDLFDLFARTAKHENDFPWGLAYHPYPQNLRDPRTWDDEVTNDFDTPYITPKNIAVLPRYLDQPHLHFQNKPRPIILSEQGANAPTLSEEDQLLQAAAIAYIMNKVRPHPTIEAFHYHAYRDNPEHEGGLLLGLTNLHHGHKKAWSIYAAIDTPEEKSTTAFAWPLIGIPPPE